MKIKKINIIKRIIYKYCFLIFIINFNIDIKYIFYLLEEKKVRGFLNVIALCEGTKKKDGALTNPYPSLNEYMISFINAEKITNLERYPNKLFCGKIRHGKVCASAAGRYQFIKNTWENLNQNMKPDTVYKNNIDLFENYFYKIPYLYQQDVVDLYKTPKDLIKYKFGPFWQDFYAIILLLQCDSVKEILNNNHKDLIKKASKVWSTLPVSSGLSRYESNINHAQPLKYILNLCKKYMSKK